MAALIPLRWVLAQKVCPRPRNQSASETAELIRLSSSWSHRKTRFLTPSKAIGKSRDRPCRGSRRRRDGRSASCRATRRMAYSLRQVRFGRKYSTPFSRKGEHWAPPSPGKRCSKISMLSRPGRVPSHARSAGIGSAAGRAHYIGVTN
jgi:hypothetical protein